MNFLNRRLRPSVLLYLSLIVSLLWASILTNAEPTLSAEQPDPVYQQLNQSGADFSVMDHSDNVEFVGQIGGVVKAVAMQRNHVYFGNGPGLVILDNTIPLAPRVVGKTAYLQGVVRDVAVAGSYAYVAAGEGGLHIINVTNPQAPTATGFYDTLGNDKGVAVAGNYVYIAAGGGGLRIINVSDPAAPFEAGFFRTPADARAVAVSGNYAYVAEYNTGLRIINVSDPAAPFEAGFWSGYVFDVAVAGNFAYVAGGGGLRIINVANPATPTETSFYDTPGLPQAVAVAGNYAYVANFHSGLSIINIADPARPSNAGHSGTSGDAYDVAVDGSFAYVAELDGLRIFDVADPYAMTETGFHRTPEAARDVAVAGNYAYVAGFTCGEYYSDCPFTSGLHIINITNPAVPTETGLYIPPRDAGIYGLAVDGKYVYIADGKVGLRIINVADPADPNETGGLSLEDPVDVAVAENYAYVAGKISLHTINISNPAAPSETGFYETPYDNRAVAVAGNYAYVTRYSGLQIVNVADPVTPIGTGYYKTPGNANGVDVAGNYAYVADDAKGLQIIDVSNPADPTEAGTFNTTGSAFGVAVDGKYAYVADGKAGLRIINIANPTDPFEAGFFDTPGFAQAVAVDGNTIYVADREGGLFILRYLGPVFDVDPHRIDISGKAGESLAKKINVLELGGVYGIKGIGISTTDLIDEANNTIPANSISIEPASFDLSAGGNQVVTMAIPLASELPKGIYRGSVTVESLFVGTKSVPITINVGLGSITIKKQTDPAGASSFSFAGDLGNFSLYGGESKVFNGLTADHYTVTETNRSGWFLDSIYCDSENVSNSGNGRTIDLAAGEDISCTFINHRLSITAEAGGPYIGNKGFPIALDASGTNNKELVTLYIWDCKSDGAFYEVSRSPTDSACTYEKSGSYTVELKVIDIFDRISSDTAELIVAGINNLYLPMTIKP